MLTREMIELLERWANHKTIPWDEAHEALRAALDTLGKLPVTADGVAAVPGDLVYGIGGKTNPLSDWAGYKDGYIFQCIVRDDRAEEFCHSHQHDPDSFRVEDCYSTEEAASAARQAGGGE